MITNLFFAKVVQENELQRKVNFRLFETNLANKDEGIDIMFPCQVVYESCKRYSYTSFRIFLGKWVPFPIVDRYVGNVWKKFGLEKVMMNASGFSILNFHPKKVC